MTDEKYEGWANRETWSVTLWIANDEPMYRRAVSMAPALVEMVERDGMNAAADHVRDWIEGIVLGPVASATLTTELVTDALARVEWREVVGAITEYIDH